MAVTSPPDRAALRNHRTARVTGTVPAGGSRSGSSAGRGNMATVGNVSSRGLRGLSPFDGEPSGRRSGVAITFFGFTGKVDMAAISPRTSSTAESPHGHSYGDSPRGRQRHRQQRWQGQDGNGRKRSPRGLRGQSPFDREPRGHTGGGAIAFFGISSKVGMAVTSPRTSCTAESPHGQSYGDSPRRRQRWWQQCWQGQHGNGRNRELPRAAGTVPV
jgi:hypothetical protein